MKRLTAVAALVLVLAGCSKLDDKKIEESITTELKTKGVLMKSVDCPEGRPVKNGDEFTCSGLDQDNIPLVFHVQQTDGAGSIKWQLEGMILDQAKVGDGIEAKVGKAADVQCPAKVLIMKVGTSFTCPVLVEGARHSVEITLDNDKGDVHWKITS